DLLIELTGPGDDPRIHRRVVLGEEGAVDKAELRPKLPVLLLCRLALKRLLAELVHLLPEAFVLALGVHETAEVAVDVAERTRHALGRHLEGPQHRHAGALHLMKRARRGGPERPGEQD